MEAVSGLNIKRTVAVESPEHLSEVLRDATDADTPVLPLGGGTCLSTGYPTDHEFIALDLSALSGIVDYNPTDMTAGFLGNTPMRIVSERLADNGQELPIDLPLNDAGTIGGLVATGHSGPRRYGQGTLKDLLIGCEYVRGDGLIAKAGGMTVKNVSGFEISRMLHGSWGSLAVLTRVNLKVVPIARAERTLSWKDKDLHSALGRQQRLLQQFSGAIAIQSRQTASEWETSIRFTGREPAVEDYQRQAVSMEGEASGGDERDVWAGTLASSEHPQLVVSGSASSLEGIAVNLISVGGVDTISVSFGTGTIRAQIHPDEFDPKALSTLDSNLWMIEGGDESWKQDVPVWGPNRADHEVMKSIKQQFDPANVLNRGRLFI